MKTSFIVKPLPINDIDKDTTIYQQIGDIALCLFILIADDGKNIYTTKAPMYILNAIDFSAEELIQSALITTSWFYPARIIDGERLLLNNDGTPVSITEYKPSSLNEIIGFELTNTGYSDGSVTLFYPTTCKRIAEKINDNFYAVPNRFSSFTIFPKKQFDFEVATKLLNTSTHKEDYLSSCIFYYDSKKNKLIVCKKEYNKDAYIF